jgi:hypothetical protein
MQDLENWLDDLFNEAAAIEDAYIEAADSDIIVSIVNNRVRALRAEGDIGASPYVTRGTAP